MTPEQFCYWLQGYAELNQEAPTPAQWISIMQHLNTVFDKVTPPVSVGIPGQKSLLDIKRDMEEAAKRSQTVAFPLADQGMRPMC